MGKIRLYHTDCDDCGNHGWYEASDAMDSPVVEVPEAIIADWRETIARLNQLEDYFREKVQPQIDVEYARQREEWWRAHPEEAKRQDQMREIWIKNLEAQARLNPGSAFHTNGIRSFDEIERFKNDPIIYTLIPPIKKDDDLPERSREDLIIYDLFRPFKKDDE